MVNLTYWSANFEIALLFFDFFLGSKGDILGSFGTFPAHIGGFFLNELSNQFRSNLLLPIFAVNLNYWRADFEVSILFFDFFLGSKSDISGSFGTILADIGGTFVNELTKHFTSNLLLSFVFLRSI